MLHNFRTSYLERFKNFLENQNCDGKTTAWFTTDTAIFDLFKCERTKALKMARHAELRMPL